MATELRTFIWCDVHLAEKDEQVEGRPWALVSAPDPAPAREPGALRVDLCDDCAHAAGVVALQELIFTYGMTLNGEPPPRRKRPEPAAAAGGEFACPECDRSYDERVKLASHGRRVHDKSIAELLGEPAPHVCETCGAAFGLPTSLATHRTRSHPN